VAEEDKSKYNYASGVVEMKLQTIVEKTIAEKTIAEIRESQRGTKGRMIMRERQSEGEWANGKFAMKEKTPGDARE